MSKHKLIAKVDRSNAVFELKEFNKAIFKSACTHQALGLAVHWLKIASKAPVVSGWSNAPILTPENLLRTHEPGFNVGFRAGEYSEVNGFNVVVLDIDIKHPDFANEAYAAANQLMGGNLKYTVISGSEVGRHQYLLVSKEHTPSKAATTLRQSDIAVKNGHTVPLGTEGSKPAWTIELLSTGKNVVMPPSIHPDSHKNYSWANGVDMGDLSLMPENIHELLDKVSGNEWQAPEVIKYELVPVDKFNATLLPEVLREFVYDIAERTQCPVDFVAVIVVQMLCVLIGNSCSIRPKQLDDWSEFPNLWAAIVGRPGQLKTPAKNKGFEPLKFLEWEAQQAYETEMSFFENAKIDLELEVQRLKNIKARTDQQQQELSSLLKEKPVEPSLRRYRSNDATIEKLAELLNLNPRGLLVERDELIGLLAVFQKAGHEADRAFYLEGWNGNGKHIVDRIGRGTVNVEHMTLSVFGSIQPAKLQKYLYEAQYGLGNDGLLQRFQLFVYPDDNPVWAIVDRDPNKKAFDAVLCLARELASVDWATYGAKCEEHHETPYFRFELDAQELFNEWYIALGKKVDNEELGIIAEHLAKYRKLVPALALVMHLVDLCTKAVPSGSGVTINALRCAIEWSKYLESHARRIYHMALDVREDAVKSLMKKIQSGELADGFTERDIYRKKWSNLGDPELVSAACNELEQANWIRRIKHDGPRYGRQKVCFEINPSINTK